MKHIGLFEGMGGFSLAAHWMGWETVAFCEISAFCQQILKYYWPRAELYGDIIQTDFSIWRGRCHILTGGFPCQPFSLAGKREGTADNRHLWPEMLRAVREIQPRWVVGENVPGLISWDAGLVFQQVQADLEAEGYQVQAFVLPACAVEAPHRRDRVWIIGYAQHHGSSAAKERGNEHKPPIPEKQDTLWKSAGTDCPQTSIAANTEGSGLERQRQTGSITENEREIRPICFNAGTGLEIGRSDWTEFPTQPPICAGDDGLPAGLDFEAVFEGKRMTFSKWRTESIKAGGNAIVPQVALQIYKAIALWEEGNKSESGLI